MGRRQWAQSEKEEIPFNENKICFHHECGEVLNRLSRKAAESPPVEMFWFQLDAVLGKLL